MLKIHNKINIKKIYVKMSKIKFLRRKSKKNLVLIIFREFLDF